MSVNSKYVKKSNKIDNFEKWGNKFSYHHVTDGDMVGHAGEIIANGSVAVIIPKSKNEGIKHNYLLRYEPQHFNVMELEGKQVVGLTDFLQDAICFAVKGEFKGKKNKVKSLICKIYKLDRETDICYGLECLVKRHKVKPIDFEMNHTNSDNKVIH